MVQSLPIALTAASLFLLPPALADGLYTKSSPVLQVSGSNYDSLIAKSNHTSIVEFYAPWCGHCKNLQPAFEKAARSLTGLAKVAAVNCDEESNKPFCGSMGVQGFPTLKIVKPGKKPGKPIVEDYQGQRTAKGIVDAVIDKIPNHVKRLKDADYQDWLEESDAPKAILFSDKGSTSALLKAVAIDFLGSIGVAQIRNLEKEATQVFHVEKYPTLVLLPGDGKDPVTYDGELKKDKIVKFLSQAASPNPDPAPKKAKSSSKTDKSRASKASSSFADASKSHASSEAKTDKASQTMESMEDDSQPTESPDPNVVREDTQKPIKVPDVAPPISALDDSLSLQQKCLNTKAGTCILALLPPVEGESASPETLQAVSSLSEIHHKHETAKRNLFPFYQLPASNTEADSLRKQLSLGNGVELIAINGKRAWYRYYPKTTFTQPEIEDWIDAIRMGDSPKSKLPDDLIADAETLPAEPTYVKLPKDYQSNPEAMREALKGQMPEGVEFEFEEMDDSEYDRVIKQAKEDAAKREAKEKAEASVVTEEEGRGSDEPIEHVEL
ncbi:uncharacterized protein LTR77_003587 [Saxophila tyrrhenica]|uniref:protein disulfide-isomerase n=1 Tax=Saxophila tyrrhenica TaxID=1690608 RepID=A0AAV9PED7_9PEZI|nr:hypothetical protein LTR77_003587 [Saxophila tyrrhenica]